MFCYALQCSNCNIKLVLKFSNRTSIHADFKKPGKNYVSLACGAPPDKSKHLNLIHVLYENDRIVAGNVWVHKSVM